MDGEPEPKTLPELKAEHRPAPRSRLSAPPGEETEQARYRNYVRDLILGFNDGAVSVYALCAGVAGAAFGTREVAIAGIAATAAGALSMGLGEYLSTKSQAQYYEAEARREREHIQGYRGLEKQELREMLAQKGYPPDVVERLVEHLAADEDRFVDFMMREEFGVGKESERSPAAAMALIAAAFVVAAALPVAPYLLGNDLGLALRWSTGLSLGGLFAAGFAKGRLSGLSGLRAGLEMAALGAAAAALTFGIGHYVGTVVS